MSDEEWDAEGFEPKVFKAPGVVAADRWEGEDEEEEAPDDWEAADDDEEKPQQPTQEVSTKKKKSLAERIAEKEEKRREELERRRREEDEAAAKALSPEEQLAEKLRRQKMQEDADLELAMETFGVDKSSLPSGSPLDVSPSTKEEFDEFRKALTEKLRSLETRPLYNSFLEELVRDLCWNLDSDDVKKVSTSLNALYNEKVKNKQKGKKGAKKGAKLHVEKSLIDDFEDFI